MQDFDKPPAASWGTIHQWRDLIAPDSRVLTAAYTSSSAEMKFAASREGAVVCHVTIVASASIILTHETFRRDGITIARKRHDFRDETRRPRR